MVLTLPPWSFLELPSYFSFSLSLHPSLFSFVTWHSNIPTLFRWHFALHLWSFITVFFSNSVLWNWDLSTVVAGDNVVYGAVHNYILCWVCQAYDDGIINGYRMFLQLLFARNCSCSQGHMQDASEIGQGEEDLSIPPWMYSRVIWLFFYTF